jgi:hypothetical protein
MCYLQLHGVINASVVEVEVGAIIHFDAFLDLLKLLDFHALARFGDAMVEKDVAVAVAAQRFDLSQDFLGGLMIVLYPLCHSGRRASS